MNNSFKVNFKIEMKLLYQLEQFVAEVKRSSKSGQLGKLNLVKNVLQVIDESKYLESKTSQDQKSEGELDIVELVVTCIAAFIVISAIVWCLFYLCTTPAERARCNCCKACRRNQTAP